MSRFMDIKKSYSSGISQFQSPRANQRLREKKKNDLRDEEDPHETLIDNLLNKPIKDTFPITKEMLVVSGIFWTGSIILIYLIISYGSVYARVKHEEDLEGPCLKPLSSKEHLYNLNKVKNYSIGLSETYIHQIRPSKTEDYPTDSNKLPPIVTAVTPDQFYQIQGLIHHVMEDLFTVHPDLKLIVYDLGLSEKERNILEKYCHCSVRDVKFFRYPLHVADIKTYAWRPIVLQTILEEYGAVLYVEPTTRFKSPSSLNYVRMRGTRNYFLWDYLELKTLVGYTDPDMFKYLQEERCAFLEGKLISSEAIVLYRTETTWTELMEPWLKCAFNKDCIAPVKSRFSGCIAIRHPKTTGCHRYDMSALSIILNRVQQYTINKDKMVSFRLTFTDQLDYSVFPEQPWTWKQIIIIILCPFIAFALYKILKRRRLCRLM